MLGSEPHNVHMARLIESILVRSFLQQSLYIHIRIYLQKGKPPARILYILYRRYQRSAPPPLRYRFYGFLRRPFYSHPGTTVLLAVICGDEKVTGRSRIGLTIKSVSMNCRHRRPYTQNPFCRHHPFPADR